MADTRRLSWLAIISLFLNVVAAFLMVASECIEYKEGWSGIGQTIRWALRYYSSIAVFVMAAIFWLSAIAIHGWRRPDVNLAIFVWMASFPVWFVFFVWWPTPELLVKAAAENNPNIVRRCLKYGVDIDVNVGIVGNSSLNKMTGLTAAVGNNNVEVVDLLLSEGANPNQPDGNGYPPLQSTQSWMLRDRLLTAGANIDAKGPTGKTLLERLCFGNDDQGIADFESLQREVVLLVERGATITDVARFSAFDQPDLRLANLIETRCRERDVPETNCSLAFLSALLFGEDEIAEAIFRKNPKWKSIKKINKDENNEPGNPKVFWIAIRCGRPQPLRVWLTAAQQSKSKMMTQYVSFPSISIAAAHGHVEILELLTEFGADVPNSNALIMAARFNQLNAGKWLIENEVNINKTNGIYGNALTNAIWNGNLVMVKLLVEHGASLKPDQFGTGQFDLAVRNSQREIAAFMLSEGVQPDKTTYFEPWVQEILDEAGIAYKKF